MLKKLLFQALLFFSPLALLMVIELFVLPINAFNYRGWEALSVYSLYGNRLLPGPFYPNRKLEMTAQGDLGYYTKFAVSKKVEWITDRYGFRVRDRDDGRWDIVIIGDSFVVCPGVTQEETLAATLERRTGMSVYPYNISATEFFRETRFRRRPPKILVLAYDETDLKYLGQFPAPEDIVPLPEPCVAEWKTYSLTQADRLLKAGMWRFVRASIRRALVRTFIDSREPLNPGIVVSNRGSMLFQAESPTPPLTVDEIEKIAVRVNLFARTMEKQGIRVIVMPIPDKATIYSDLLDGRWKSNVPNLAGTILARHEVETVALQPAFENARRLGVDSYFSDDTHWNSRGIEIAADLLAKQIVAKPIPNPKPF